VYIVNIWYQQMYAPMKMSYFRKTQDVLCTNVIS